MQEHYAANARFRRLADRISYSGLRIEIDHELVSDGYIADGGNGRLHHAGHFLRVACDDGTCNITSSPLSWKGRKWRLSRHMTDMEVVNTAFLAIMTALEHEARERFRVDGIAIMDSHRDLERTLAFMTDGGGQGRA